MGSGLSQENHDASITADYPPNSTGVGETEPTSLGLGGLRMASQPSCRAAQAETASVKVPLQPG